MLAGGQGRLAEGTFYFLRRKTTMSVRRWRQPGLRLILLCALSPVLFGLQGPQQAHAATYTVSIYPEQQYQTIEGWGTTLAWWANIIGGWSNTQRNAVADAIFSPTKGLGLNVVRYNIGADTPTNVCHNQMRPGGNTPSYEPSAGTYDWTQDANQRWMAQAALARGAYLFEGQANSAPSWMLLNNCTAGPTTASTDNLSSAYYADYVSYLATVAQHFHDTWGIPFSSIEPFNEPTGNWWTSKGNQEGMYVSQGVQNTLVKQLGAQLGRQGITAYSSVSAPDDNTVGWSINDYNAYDSTARSYLAQWNTHTYGGSSSDRTNAYNTIGVGADKRLWMSEWGAGDQGSQIGAGLALSDEILLDENYLHPSAWVIWQAVNSGGGTPTDDWGLAFMDGNNNISYPSRYYAMGNYSEFVHPGYVMIGNSDPNTFSAYDAGSHTLVIVATNPTSTSNTITYDLSGFNSAGSTATPHRTSATENLVQLANLSVSNHQFSSFIPADSITTFVIHNVAYTGRKAATEVDDSMRGGGLNRFNYVGSGWQHCTGGCWNDTSGLGLYNGSTSWDGTANDSVSIKFNGTRIRFFGVKDTNEGIGLVSIDGGPTSEIDFYAAKRAGNQFMWESPQLSPGTHTFKLTVSGRKNPLSTNYWIAPDRVEITHYQTIPDRVKIERGAATGSLVKGLLPGTVRNSFTGQVGMEFTTGSAPLRVTSLGREYISGNSQTHILSLYRASDHALLGSTSIDMSRGSADRLGFKYASLSSPIVLAAHTTYFLMSSETNGGDQWYDLDSTVLLGAGASVNGPAWTSDGTTFTAYTPRSTSYGPVNLLHT
jgi:O-glycosyl hydrolase